MKRFLRDSILIVILCVAVFLIFTILKKPSLDRNWTDDSKVLPDITIGTSTVTVNNLRDWRYERGIVVESSYYEEIFDLNKIDKHTF